MKNLKIIHTLCGFKNIVLIASFVMIQHPSFSKGVRDTGKEDKEFSVDYKSKANSLMLKFFKKDLGVFVSLNENPLRWLTNQRFQIVNRMGIDFRNRSYGFSSSKLGLTLEKGIAEKESDENITGINERVSSSDEYIVVSGHCDRLCVVLYILQS